MILLPRNSQNNYLAQFQESATMQISEKEWLQTRGMFFGFPSPQPAAAHRGAAATAAAAAAAADSLL